MIIEISDIVPNLFICSHVVAILSQIWLKSYRFNKEFEIVAISSFFIAHKAVKACMIENSPFHVMVYRKLPISWIFIS